MLFIAFFLGMTGGGIVPLVREEITLSAWILAVSSVIHVLMIWGEVSLTHPTAHARLAVWEMTQGRYKTDFWLGVALTVVGGLFPMLAITEVMMPEISIAGVPPALIGMMLFEHAYVQAGQSVPLA